MMNAKGEEPVDGDDPARHGQFVDRAPEVDDDHSHDRPDRDREDRPPHVPDGDVPPPVLVEAEEDEDSELNAHDDREDRRREELVVARRHALVEAHLEGEIPRKREKGGVGRDLPDSVTARQPHAPLPSRFLL